MAVMVHISTEPAKHAFERLVWAEVGHLGAVLHMLLKVMLQFIKVDS